MENAIRTACCSLQAGGSEDDPALRELLHTLSSLPPCLLSSGGDHVRRGGVIAFHRTCEPREGEPDACTLHVAAGEMEGGAGSSSGCVHRMRCVSAWKS